MLDVRALHVNIGGIQILRGIDLSVRQGQVVTVLGANGAGKTTLMRALAGIYPADARSISFHGRELKGRPSHEIVRAGLAQIPEGRQVFGAMSVMENLLLGAGTASLREARSRAEEVLADFPSLQQRTSQPAGSLSGGEQQMLAIARALASRPRLLALDEPTLGLAPRYVDRVFELVARLRGKQLSVLLVEQNARRALAVADYAYVLERGRVSLQGPSAALRDDPRVNAAYLGAAANSLH